MSKLLHLIRKSQAAFAPYRVEGQSVVDELIAERRAEAAREDAEFSTGEWSRLIAVQTALDANRSVRIPDAFLAELGWHAGETLTVECDGDSLLIRHVEGGKR